MKACDSLAIGAPLLSPHESYPLMSMPRFVLAAFPLFVALGGLLARRRAARIAYLAVCLPIGAFLTTLFVTSRWVA